MVLRYENEDVVGQEEAVSVRGIAEHVMMSVRVIRAAGLKVDAPRVTFSCMYDWLTSLCISTGSFSVFRVDQLQRLHKGEDTSCSWPG